MSESYDHLFKIILAGDTSVGKTNLVHLFVKGNHQDIKNIAPTIGVQFATRIVTLSDQKRIKTQIWDTAGQQQYRSITTARALGAIVVYDITKEKTFINVKRWIEAIRQQADPNVVIVLVGNKIDLRNYQVVSTTQARKWAKNQGIYFEQSSALTNQNVQNIFMKMIEEINKRKKQNDYNNDRGEDLWWPKQKQKCQC